MSSQGTGGPKGRPMEEAPKGDTILAWDGESWVLAYFLWDRWAAATGPQRAIYPKCWMSVRDAPAYLPPPVLP